MRDYCGVRDPDLVSRITEVGLPVAGDFEARFREALRRRLYPNAPLHLKQLARAIGRSENTVARWWRGETRILADDLYRLADFMAARGDRDFLTEIFTGLLPDDLPMDGAAAQVLKLVRSAFASANRETPIGRDTHYWFSADGEIASAPTGHADYVRGALQLAGTTGDIAAYAMRVLGWIAVTLRGDGSLIVRHDGRRIAPRAAERICDWIEDHGDGIVQVRRSVLIDGHWIEAQHPNAQAAALAIAKVALIVRVARRPWKMKLLPVDAITDARLKALIRLYQQEPERLIHGAAAMGAFTTSSLFGVHGDEVVSYHVGTDLGFDPSMVEGINVLARPDTEYAVMLQSRILKARREGPIYAEFCGTIDAYNVRYLNLTLPEPGPNGRVLTSSVVFERDLLAAA